MGAKVNKVVAYLKKVQKVDKSINQLPLNQNKIVDPRFNKYGEGKIPFLARRFTPIEEFGEPHIWKFNMHPIYGGRNEYLFLILAMYLVW